KPLHSAGGLGIRRAHPGEAPSPHHYFQEFIDGTPMSVLYCGTTLLGVTQQLVGEPWLHAKPFAYCGNIGPLDTPPPALATRADLCGVWGIDFISHDGVPHVLEVNPRYTASAEVLEHGTGAGVFAQRPNPPTLFPEGKGVNARNAPPDFARQTSADVREAK